MFRRTGGDERQVQVPAHGAGVERHRPLAVDGELRPPLERFLDPDAALHPGERGPETEVDPVAQGHV
jgi:hypothetical protein